MNNGSMSYNTQDVSIDNSSADKFFSLGNFKKWKLFRDADCELKDYSKQSLYKEAECNLESIGNHHANYESLVKSDVDCNLVEYDREKQHNSAQGKESRLKADFEWEHIINCNIETQLQSEATALLRNAYIALACSILYILFFIIAGGDHTKQIIIVLTIALIGSVLNLFGNVVLYMIDCDYALTRNIADFLDIEPLCVQKAYSDRKLLMLECELSKLKIAEDRKKKINNKAFIA